MSQFFKFSLALAGATLLANCASSDPEPDAEATCVAAQANASGAATSFAELVFDKPFGQDAPVEMATVFGDRATGNHATVGVFGAGFDSGPHTHSQAYHGVVVQGRMTNPFGTEGSPREMGPGSYWFVPAGEQHATRCVSTDEPCVFYFHADDGFDFTPLDVLDEARSGAAVTMTSDAAAFEDVAPFVAMASAWGDRAAGEHGTFGRFPGNASSPEHVHTGEYLGVVISGTLINPFAGAAEGPLLTAGSAWRVPAGTHHRTARVSVEPCVFYFHAAAAFDFTPVCAP
ncbi:MAG: quercetin dioxygenase-like cupin family protein [Myxococcota bacterium]|jgi:quercetin dioxygenase-like cupin family protein